MVGAAWCCILGAGFSSCYEILFACTCYPRVSGSSGDFHFLKYLLLHSLLLFLLSPSSMQCLVGMPLVPNFYTPLFFPRSLQGSQDQRQHAKVWLDLPLFVYRKSRSKEQRQNLPLPGQQVFDCLEDRLLLWCVSL